MGERRDAAHAVADSPTMRMTTMTIRLQTAAIALALMTAPALATAQPAVTAGTFHDCPEGGRTKVAKVKALNVLKNRATVPETINRDATLEALAEKGDD